MQIFCSIKFTLPYSGMIHLTTRSQSGLCSLPTWTYKIFNTQGTSEQFPSRSLRSLWCCSYSPQLEFSASEYLPATNLDGRRQFMPIKSVGYESAWKGLDVRLALFPLAAAPSHRSTQSLQQKGPKQLVPRVLVVARKPHRQGVRVPIPDTQDLRADGAAVKNVEAGSLHLASLTRRGRTGRLWVAVHKYTPSRWRWSQSPVWRTCHKSRNFRFSASRRETVRPYLTAKQSWTLTTIAEASGELRRIVDAPMSAIDGRFAFDICVSLGACYREDWRDKGINERIS